MFFLIVSSTDDAVDKFIGYSIPWVIIVDSNATIGRFSDKADFTSDEIIIK